ncbi:radical SAM/SPASM domain-containing protein [Mariniradius sediminis]|uniref:SPASM domain-containing protein n=1 Tax=Mariniradius sediminis TaxID=2909237 RepID=A0ABS9BZE3_9BACT|nr:SPASM domain-containing protein [Mariniradius sediminis]
MKNQWHTGLAWLRYLSLKKLYNFTLLYFSFQLSQIIRKPIHWGKPTTLSIEPTTSCNLRCPECPSGLRSFTRPTGMLSKQLFEKAIEQSKDYLTYLHLYFQGEPFLHPEFLELVSLADQNQIFTATSTNAHYIHEDNVDKILQSGLKQLIVSMDGMTQEVYQDYRIGGKLEKVQKGLSLLLNRRRETKNTYPRIVLQYLVTGKNEQQIPALKDWARTIGVDELQLKTTQIYDFEDGSDLIPKDLNYSRYIPTANGKWKLKKTIENKCWRMWQGAVITWDGRMLPCCFDKDGKYTMGKLPEQTIPAIWSNSKYQNFRKMLLQNRKQIDICQNCTE